MRRKASEITYDVEANQAYVHLVAAGAGASKKQVVLDDADLPGVIVVDLDGDGRIRGFELLDGAPSLPQDLLNALR